MLPYSCLWHVVLPFSVRVNRRINSGDVHGCLRFSSKDCIIAHPICTQKSEAFMGNLLKLGIPPREIRETTTLTSESNMAAIYIN